MSTIGFTAQAYGAGDADEVRAILARGLVAAGVLAAVVLILQVPLGLAAFYLFDASQGVEELARIYFDVRIWSAPAALANYVLLGCFLGTQNPRAALIHLIFLNGVNIILDVLFVVGLGWGVAGVAAASVIAEYGGFLLGLALTVVYALGGDLIVSLLTGFAEVRAAASDFLIWAVLLPLVSVWSYQLDGIFVGATATAPMRNGMALSLAAFGLTLWLALPVWGNHGLWLAFLVFMVARALPLAVRYPAIDRMLACDP